MQKCKTSENQMHQQKIKAKTTQCLLGQMSGYEISKL